MRRGGAAAILLGAAVGATAALALRPNNPPSVPALPHSIAAPAHAPSPSAPASTLAPPPAPALAPVSTLAPAPTPTSSTPPPAPLTSALPPVTTPAELERAEIRCYQTAPEDCGRAADAYDIGTLVPRDAARAEKLRKVELTRLVRQCEQRSPHACLVLAGRYQSGQGVPESEKHAQGLLEHARDLCRHGAAKSECNGGSRGDERYPARRASRSASPKTRE